MSELNLFIAFTAGLASFLAPCVVPLVPTYISFISGVSFSEFTKNHSQSRYASIVLVNSLLYILGFSLIFVLLGIGATTLSKALIINRVELLKIGGIFIIFFGLFTLGIFNKFTFFQREAQFQIPDSVRKIKYFGPFVMGTTFALAWTPCVSPILGAILALAATSQNVASGISLLFVYSLGISLPFLIIALTISSSYRLLKKLGPSLKYITWASGLLLVIIGILMITQKYDLVTGFLLGQLNKLDIYRNLQNSF